MATADREIDEAVLTMIRLRALGETSAKIAKRFHTSPEYVRVCTNKVRGADLRESGEDRDAVARRYWGRR